MEIEQLGPYKIGRKLGRGGMGTVYEATLVDSGEKAAVKILSATLAHDDGFRERFKSEIETLRKLRHPNIVRLFGFGEQGEQLFYVMELVQGRSLEDELLEGRRFHWREVTDYAIQTCRALKHAHDRGVIHRDIKPANLLLTPEGQIKLSDFGIAKLFGTPGMTAVGGVLGTAEYMAPEQTDGRPITPRCDLYSLGGVMYMLLAGRPPFKAGTLVEMLQLQRYAEPDPVRRYAPDAPEQLQFILSDLLTKDPDQRIATAMVLSRRLEAMRHGLSVRIDPILTAPTQPVQIGPEISVSSATMTAAGQVVMPPKPADPNAADDQFGLTPPPAPHELTTAARHERALNVTADLAFATSTEKEEAKPAADSQANKPTARFVKVAEDEHRHLEPSIEPESHHGLLQTALLALTALMLAAGTWYLMQPASADRLYDRISRAEQAGDISSLQEARNDIDAFLAHYADDPRAAQIRHLDEALKLEAASRQASFRARSPIRADAASPVERAYLDAVSYSKFNPEIAAERLSALIDLYGGDMNLSGADAESIKLARWQLQQLREHIQQQADAELQLINARLDRADGLEQNDPAAARAMREAVVKLYGDKPWAAAAVERAASALAARTAAGDHTGS